MLRAKLVVLGARFLPGYIGYQRQVLSCAKYYMKHVDLTTPTNDYDPMWECIYCGWKEQPKKLGGEHILALSFEGGRKLPRSSCPSCSDKTKEFERTCARTIFGPLRLLWGYKTRHPDQRPETLPLDITIDGKTERREVPIADYPAAPLIFLTWGPPGILLGISPSEEFHSLAPQVIFPPIKDQDEKLKRLGVGKNATITLPLRFEAVAFSRFLAKTGYALAVAEFGLGSFKERVTGLIRGTDKCPAYLVGVHPGPELMGKPADINGELGFLESGGRCYLACRIQVFGFLGLPIYTVILGEAARGLKPKSETRSPRRSRL